LLTVFAIAEVADALLWIGPVWGKSPRVSTLIRRRIAEGTSLLILAPALCGAEAHHSGEEGDRDEEELGQHCEVQASVGFVVVFFDWRVSLRGVGMEAGNSA
jgi:hypothetical protein